MNLSTATNMFVSLDIPEDARICLFSNSIAPTHDQINSELP